MPKDQETVPQRSCQRKGVVDILVPRSRVATGAVKRRFGAVREVRATQGRERVRAQTDSGAIDTAGRKETARAFEMKETEMSKIWIGCTAANGSSIKNYGEKKVVG